MKQWKAAFSFIMVIVLVCSLGIIPAFADEDQTINNQTGDTGEPPIKSTVTVSSGDNDAVSGKVEDLIVVNEDGKKNGTIYGTTVTYDDSDGTPTIIVDGDVSVGQGDGLDVSNTSHDGPIAAEIKGDINSENGNGVDASANGSGKESIVIVGKTENAGDDTETFTGGTITAPNGDGVKATAENGGEVEIKTGSITAGQDAIEINCADGNVSVSSDGDVTGGTSGITLTRPEALVSEDRSIQVTIDGTLNVTSENGAPILLDRFENGENVEITVWKIEVNGEQAGEGEIVKQNVRLDDNSTGTVQKSPEAKELEDSIRYLIRISDTGDSATVFKHYKKGDTLQTGEREIVLNIPDGMDIESAYATDGNTVKIEKKADGKYYAVIPYGGGILLSAILKSKPGPGPGPKPTPADGGGSGTGLVNASQVRVIFDPDDGKWSNGKSDPIVKVGGAANWFLLPEAPSREGFRFVKWQCDDPEITQSQPGQSFCPYKVGTFTFAPLWEPV